ncbi:DUF7594 domain-containing protein [Dactylosporangium sp. McL0621]|uniref:CBM96 family carbohydrate-binding protein n=1 Tax=Dactylosporangium sp. McL0621 TaxID=3415678 RepID=UPI003CE8793F
MCARAEDTYSSSARPTYNFGASPTVVAGRQGGDQMIGFLKFKVATPASGATVKGAKVTLTRDSGNLPGTLTLNRVADTASLEKSLSGRTAPKLGTAVVTAKPAATADAVTFDVSSVVTGAGTYTFAVSSAVVNTTARFRSAEASAGQPALDVTVFAGDAGTLTGWTLTV